ncbi:MAG: nuclear transport factor 2 family protein [Ferruginibacter sp.]
METKAIAQKLADYCRKGEFEQAQKELYADDVISIEPEAMGGYDKETKGKKEVQAKINKWMSTVEELHNNKVSEPLISGNSFAVVMDMDITMKGKSRTKMSELCTYTVKDGKITSEQFFM